MASGRQTRPRPLTHAHMLICLPACLLVCLPACLPACATSQLCRPSSIPTPLGSRPDTLGAHPYLHMRAHTHIHAHALTLALRPQMGGCKARTRPWAKSASKSSASSTNSRRSSSRSRPSRCGGSLRRFVFAAGRECASEGSERWREEESDGNVS